MLADFPPGAFGLVMATGVLGIDLTAAAAPLAGLALFVIAALAWIVLGVLCLLRAARFPRRVIAELGDQSRGCDWFTLVAATSIVGLSALAIPALRRLALALLVLAAALWAVLAYAVFGALIVRAAKARAGRAITGGWLLTVVAMQSIALFAALATPGLPPPLRQGVAFASLSVWLAGQVLYASLIALILFHLLLLPVTPHDLSPPSWINMGAMAITAVTGAALSRAIAASPALERLQPFVLGDTAMSWAAAAWWIPLLFVLEVWRHILRHLPLRYEASIWGAVFPLAMFAAASRDVGAALDLTFLTPLALAFAALASLAWAASAAGLLRRLAAFFGG